MKLAEDTCFNLRYLCFCKNLLVLSSAGYHYRCYSIVRKHSFSLKEFHNHYHLFNNSISFIHKIHGYKFEVLNIQIYKAIFEALHEYLRDKSKDEFISAANKLNNYLILKDLYPFDSKRNIFIYFIYKTPKIGFYIMKFLYWIKNERNS